MAACARFADVLLHACPAVRVLATSREALGITCEAHYRVPSLALPDPDRPPPAAALAQSEAVRLFVEGARAAAPGVRLTDRNAAAVAQVCGRHCVRHPPGAGTGRRRGARPAGGAAAGPAGGPVPAPHRGRPRRPAAPADVAGGAGLELRPPHRPRAAAVRPPGGLRGRVLAGSGRGGRRDRGPHGRRGARPPDAPGGQVARGRAGGRVARRGARFRLLETLRQYAAERLQETGEAPAARDRHLAWCVALAALADAARHGPQLPVWLDRGEAERDNLRAALAWSLAGGAAEAGLRIAAEMPGLWVMRGSRAEGQLWLEALLAAGAGAATRRAWATAAVAAARRARRPPPGAHVTCGGRWSGSARGAAGT